MTSEKFLELAYNNNQTNIQMTDQKISVVIAVVAFMATPIVSLAGDLGCGWESLPTCRPYLVILLVTYAVLVLGSLFCGAITLCPRRSPEIDLGLEESKEPKGIFWAQNVWDKARFPTLASYLSAVHAAKDRLEDELAHEAMKTSCILSRKLEWGGRAIRLFVGSLLPWAVLVAYIPLVHGLAPK